jgi:hypothetical protein
MHQRRAILLAIRDQLKTLDGFKAVRIQRQGPSGNTFPNLSLYAESETVETLTIHPQPRPQERRLNVPITAWILHTIDPELVEDHMDAAAARIETGMTDRIDDVLDVLLISTDFAAPGDEQGDYSVTLTYQVWYSSVELQQTLF